MSLSLTPANVQGGVITAIAMAPLAASFATGVEVGMKGTGTYVADPIGPTMTSDNFYTDARKVTIEFDQLQNRIADVGALWVYSQAGAQAIIKTSSNDYGSFTGQTWDSETVLGVGFDWGMSATESAIKVQMMTELSDANLKTAWATTAAGSAVWTAGADATKRKRPGIKSVTVGGNPLGLLRSGGGNIKTRNAIVQLGRPIGEGLEANFKLVMAQTAQADHDGAIDISNDDDTVIINFWNGQSIKLTNLFAGKKAKLNYGKEHSIELEIAAYFPKGTSRIDYTTNADCLELIMLDNEEQA